ncbi:Cullin repeat-like-containing domain protein [Delphinella strobiligena]|nr:Cullin repeat-like-containing domain protein [Delphinella strobiligena]
MTAPKRAVFAEESAEVEVLYANLDKMKSLTKKIKSSMGRLETSGKTVEDAIGPIYGNTQRLQTITTNIDRVIIAIDRVREPLDMRNKEERILRSSPQQVGLAEYMASIDRTNQALRGLKQSNLRSNQQAITELTSLLQVGSQQLENVFRDVLQDGLQPVEPLHYITKSLEFPRLSEEKISQLRTINSHVSASIADTPSADARGTPSARIYAEVRGQYLATSLQNMAAACIATARKQNSDALYKRGDNAIGTYAAGIKGMYTAEYDSICPIFSRDEWGQILSNTCQSSLNAFSTTLRDLNRHIQEYLTQDCFLAYEIIEVVSNMSLELENRTGELKLAMGDALKPVRETAKSSLSSLITDARSRVERMPQMPGDGAALPLTTEIMSRLQTMTMFLVPVSSILTSLGDGGWSPAGAPVSSQSVPTLKSFDVGADGTLLFEHYAMDMIDTYLNTLDQRSKLLLKDKGSQGVFMVNNVAVVERMIRSSDLQPLLISSQSKIDAHRTKAVKSYTVTWNDVTRYLMDSQHTSRHRPTSTGQGVDSSAFVKSLHSKEKDSIKENFKSFNMKFDEMVAKHKSFRMEREVKAMLGVDVQRLVEPMWARYWDRYHEIDKGKGKYIKYDKAQLSAVLSGLT